MRRYVNIIAESTSTIVGPYKMIGIDPNLLGGKKNVQFIKGEENRKKWDSFQPIDVVKSITGEIDGLFGKSS